jgi:DNA-directed RNA polymerase subunit RPC12/RpoP
MAEDIKFPTWRDVGIPDQLVETIKNLRGDNLLEQLIYEKVFHNNRRMQYVYVCGVCGHQHKPEKSVEDYGQCEVCGTKAITATQHLRGWNRSHPPGCSSTDAFAQEVLVRMRHNYSVYFSKYLEDFQPEDIVVFRWRHHNGFVANYLGGNQAEEHTTAKALCKASLLVPFLWDSNFDWKTKTRKPPGRQSSILPALFEWVQRGQ